MIATRWAAAARRVEPARRMAAARALRTAAVTFSAFAIGRWAIGNVTVAVFATFAGLAITGIADFGGSMRGRITTAATTVAIGVGLTASGTWISSQASWLGCAAMFMVVAAIALTALLGGYAAAGSNALILFYVVAAGSPAPASAIADRVCGVALGGFLAVIAAAALWPAPARSEAPRYLADALSGLAVRLRRVAGTATHDPFPTAPSAGIRAALDALVDRPAAPTGTERAELYLMNDIERLEGLVGRLETAPRHAGPDVATLEWCAVVLQRCTDSLSGRGGGWAASDGPRLGSPVAPPFSIAARLIAVTASVDAHTRAATARTSDDTIVDQVTVVPAGGHGGLTVVHGARRFRANLTLRSVYVRDAVRLGAGLALATAAVHVFSLEHGFWVAFATLTVVKSNVRATGRSVGEAIAGTFVGLLAAIVIIAAFGTNTTWYAVLLPAAVAVAIFANVAVSFLAGQAGFTVVIVVLFNLLGPAGWQVGVVRVVDVVAGGLAGLVIGALAWPNGASAIMGPATADLIESSAAYLADTVHAAVDEAQHDGSRAPRRQPAADAAVRAENTFAQYLSEHPAPERALGWAHLLAVGNRLWYAADLIAVTPDGRTQHADETVAAADRLRDRYRALAASLRGRQPCIEDARGLPTATSTRPGWSGGSTISRRTCQRVREADTPCPTSR